MAWQIEYSGPALKQLKKLGREQAERIRKYMKERVAPLDNPRDIGEQLLDPKFQGYWRYRVGDYRVVCEIQDEVLVIVVVKVGKRDKIYDE